MKRSTIVSIGTLAGIAGVLGFNPEAPTMTASSSTSIEPALTTSGAATTQAKTAATPAATAKAVSTAAPATAVSGTIAGKTIQTRWGPIQLSASVESGKIISIDAIQVPANDGRSQQISSYSIPLLTDQAIAAQSSSIQGVSGATYTTQGYKQSLQSILDQL